MADEGKSIAPDGRGDSCRECQHYIGAPHGFLDQSMAYCTAYQDSIARDAKGARHCRRMVERWQ